MADDYLDGNRPAHRSPDADDFHALLAREELRRARTGETLTIAMLDVDGLRWVNAHHGAGAGSDVLRLCVSTLRSSLRAMDELARTGPDEFGVLLHATDSRNASVWADRFEDELQAVSFEMDAGPVTCSDRPGGHIERHHADGGRHPRPPAHGGHPDGAQAAPHARRRRARPAAARASAPARSMPPRG